MTLVPCLLAGGSGTRLWPLSRELYPKQFLRLVDEHSLLQNTALRAQALPDAGAPIALCGEQHRFIVAEQLREIDIKPRGIWLEPSPRNTAPAIACAAHAVLAEGNREAMLLVLAADHVIADTAAFVEAVALAQRAARDGYIVTFGIRPTRAETGFGYMRAGAALPSGALAIEAFVEKPPRAQAEAYLAEKNYFWNGGMFLFRADVFLEELRRFEPAMEAACAEAVAASKRDLDFCRLQAEAFQQARAESVDYAVMEKTQKAALAPLDAGWDDVGSWSYLESLNRSDAHGNIAHGDVWLENVENSVLHAESRLVAAVGIRDHIVVETRDAVLVTTREHAQDVRAIVQRLKRAKRREAEQHPRVYRPWGWYETLALGERFQVKHILVKPGERLSLQLHHHRAEHWVVVHGTARVTCGEETFLLSEDESTYIPVGRAHRLENPGMIPLELIEVQSGAYLGEDDIVRITDDYGRGPSPQEGL